MAHIDAMRGQHLFDHAQAERKAEIEPHGVADDLAWKAIAGVGGLGCGCQAGHLPAPAFPAKPRPKLTVPWRLQREVLPGATVVLDWWHVAVRFEHALQTAPGIGAGTARPRLADGGGPRPGRAKWRLWHGRWAACRRQLAELRLWTTRRHVRDLA